MKRRRYATCHELIVLLTERLEDARAWVGDVVVELEKLGVPVDALVKIEVDEDPDPSSMGDGPGGQPVVGTAG